MNRPYPYPAEEPTAYVLWTGQSNAVQPWDDGSPADTIEDGAEIWNGAAFVPMAANVGGLSADATTHSLFNMTAKMLTEGPFSKVRVIMVAEGSRPISDWVGTTADRTKSAGNTPKYAEIQTAIAAARVAVGETFALSHVVMIQGEQDAARDMLPLDKDGTYGFDRVLFKDWLIEDGYAGDATFWAEVEVLPRNVSNTQFRANRGIWALEYWKHDNTVVVPTNDFIGEDEGVTVTLNGEVVETALHFTAEENSLLGTRIFKAFQGIGTGRAPMSDAQLLQRAAPDGQMGLPRPLIQINASTETLAPEWARGGVIRVTGACTITLPQTDLRTGFVPAGGRWIEFVLDATAELTLITEGAPMRDLYALGVAVNTIERVGGLGESSIVLMYNGGFWEILKDATQAGKGTGPGGQGWHMVPGVGLTAFGSADLSRAAGSTVAVTFDAGMPAIDAVRGFIVCSNCCTAVSFTASGFTLTRAATIDAGVPSITTWQLLGATLA